MREPLPYIIAKCEGLFEKPLTVMAPTSFTTIGTFWLGPRLPDFHALCVRSWLSQGYKVDFFSYEHVENVPDGCNRLNADEILSRHLVFQKRPEILKRPAGLADAFRMAMFTKGGRAWCDPDYLMLRRLPSATNILVGREKSGYLCNAVLWIRPDLKLIPRILRSFEQASVASWSYAKAYQRQIICWLTRNPMLATGFPSHQWGRHALDFCLWKYGLDREVLDYKSFYFPVVYDNRLTKPDEPFEYILTDPSIFGLHFFWKKENEIYEAPEGSFFHHIRTVF
jgi:hypothetical protein